MATYPKILSLCTGYGGLDLGIRLAEPGARTVCMVERELFAVANLERKIEAGCLDDCPIWSNLETFDGKPWRGKVDCITAGIPCQPWSVAGKQQGIDDERWIWDDIYRIVREVRPEWFFVEEVRGFIRGGLGLVIRDLADIGYVGTYDIFRASDVGAPHKRERIFMLARLADALRERRQQDARSTHGDEAQDERRPTKYDNELAGHGESGYWPTGPGQEQHAWEPPRVVADANSRRCDGRNNDIQDTSDGSKGSVADAPNMRRQAIEWSEPDGLLQCDLADGANTGAVRGDGTQEDATGRLGEGRGSQVLQCGQAQSPLGRNFDECSAPLGRCICVPENRIDELRLLGNGVVPLVAAVAWRTLKDRLIGTWQNTDTE